MKKIGFALKLILAYILGILSGDSIYNVYRNWRMDQTRRYYNHSYYNRPTYQNYYQPWRSQYECHPREDDENEEE